LNIFKMYQFIIMGLHSFDPHPPSLVDPLDLLVSTFLA